MCVHMCTAQILVGWVLTLIVAGFISAGIAAWGVYSPNKQMSLQAVSNANVIIPRFPADLYHVMNPCL